MNRRIGSYALVLAPMIAACAPQTHRDQDPPVIAQAQVHEPLPREYEHAWGQFQAAQFSTIEEVVSIRDQMRIGMESLSAVHPGHRFYRQGAQAALDRLSARVQNHEAYLALKQGIVAWLQSDPQRLESLASAENERGGYFCLENGQVRFQEVEQDDQAAISIRDDIKSLSAKVQAQTATQEDYSRLVRGLRDAEELMTFRLNLEAASNPDLAARVIRGFAGMTDYLEDCYRNSFSQDLIPADFAETESEFLRWYTLMIIRAGILIPPADAPNKVTVHTHPDFGQGAQGPSAMDVNLSRGIIVRNQHTGDTRPAMAGFVVAFGQKTVSVYGYDFGQAELIGEFTRD